jgi:hypothetical protein
VTFFDIGSTKAKQFGFQMIYDGGKVLTCCGDEPYNECEEKYDKRQRLDVPRSILSVWTA